MNWYQGFENCVRENVALARKTTYGLGGPAQFYAEPADAATLAGLLARAASAGIPVRVLGRGANLLISDNGITGLVVHLPKVGFGFAEQNELKLRVGAAHALPELVKSTVLRGLKGLESLQGIPGTVGAALRMNAGGKYGEIGSSVRRVQGFNLQGVPFDFTHAECGFVYRNSNLTSCIITECSLELQSGDPVQLHDLAQQIHHEKAESQHLTARSAGCVFKNPKLPSVPSAGKLIDQLGLKGTQIGGASVSNIHANFLICRAAARADDVVKLIRLIRERVQSACGVHLELEIETWGFDSQEIGAGV